MRTRSVLLGLAFGVAASIAHVHLDRESPLAARIDVDLARPAEATTAILATLEELVGASYVTAIAEAKERTSRWEELAGGRRIVTYTRLVLHERLVGGAESEREIVVRTLGGKVDKIGQQVAGEANFTIGERCVVFLSTIDDATVVTAMAQGHYPLVAKDGKPRLAASPSLGNLLPRRGPSLSARERLVGATLESARTEIAAAARAMGK
jgi:hypothetical protein